MTMKMKLRHRALLLFAIFVVCRAQSDFHGDPNDEHGGVPMGIPKTICDDGKVNINIDWDPNSSEEYTCTEPRKNPPTLGLHFYQDEEKAQKPMHICLPEKINYQEDLPTSGAHRPLWAQFGEYVYLPRQRWLHNLEHGAVVFLYHPCADPDQILIFKTLARNCLWKHIITPSKLLPPDMNFALLTWTHKLLLSDPDYSRMISFIKTYALKAPEGMMFEDGQYKVGLLHPASIVSDAKDSVICPTNILMGDTAEDIKKQSEERLRKNEISRNQLTRIIQSLMNSP
ncbi:uncharacterized protein LOC106050986 isoform X1 [Biomphalaria glabrata]|uniref:Uncharacterized protein LOC106050986 isoform X1 n=2 Tax=Biomphalaria glabrata TaxID=6526 RepID=A0A9W2YGV0_BIOGL|nr:uncharacterized protein LOC106050986 isoform X1 [Biomphalaria glabrata]